MHVSEIRVNRILVNQGLGVLSGEDDMQNVFFPFIQNFKQNN